MALFVMVSSNERATAHRSGSSVCWYFFHQHKEEKISREEGEDRCLNVLSCASHQLKISLYKNSYFQSTASVVNQQLLSLRFASVNFGVWRTLILSKSLMEIMWITFFLACVTLVESLNKTSTNS